MKTIETTFPIDMKDYKVVECSASDGCVIAEDAPIDRDCAVCCFRTHVSPWYEVPDKSWRERYEELKADVTGWSITPVPNPDEVSVKPHKRHKPRKKDVCIDAATSEGNPTVTTFQGKEGVDWHYTCVAPDSERHQCLNPGPCQDLCGACIWWMPKSPTEAPAPSEPRIVLVGAAYCPGCGFEICRCVEASRTITESPANFTESPMNGTLPPTEAPVQSGPEWGSKQSDFEGPFTLGDAPFLSKVLDEPDCKGGTL